MTGNLHEDQYTFMIICFLFLLKLKMFQTVVVEKIKTHILTPITVFFFENRAIYEIMVKKNIVE